MKQVLILSLLGNLLIGCGPNAAPSTAPGTAPVSTSSLSMPLQSGTLTVFAAASLIEAFSEIAGKFHAAYPSIVVMFNFAGSQTLQAQIEGGAPADVFVSANKTNLDALVSTGFVESLAPQLLLTNSLVVVVPESNPAQIESLLDLARPGIKLVLADETVPAGKYARQILENTRRDPTYGENFAKEVLVNVVSNEVDVKQVVAKVQLGEADAGIVYASDPIAAQDLKTISIPPEINVVAQYFIAPVRVSTEPNLAGIFIEYLLSAEGQTILQKWGFSPVYQAGGSAGNAEPTSFMR